MIQKSMFPLAFCGNDGIDSYVRKYFVILFIFQLFSKYAVNAVIAVKNEILLIFLAVSIFFRQLPSFTPITTFRVLVESYFCKHHKFDLKITFFSRQVIELNGNIRICVQIHIGSPFAKKAKNLTTNLRKSAE